MLTPHRQAVTLSSYPPYLLALLPSGHLAAFSPHTAKQLIAHDVLSAVVALMQAPVQVGVCCGGAMEEGQKGLISCEPFLDPPHAGLSASRPHPPALCLRLSAVQPMHTALASPVPIPSCTSPPLHPPPFLPSRRTLSCADWAFCLAWLPAATALALRCCAPRCCRGCRS